MADTTDKPKKPRKTGVKPGTAKLNRNRLESGLTAEQEAYCRARAMGMSIEEAVTASDAKVSLYTARKWEHPNTGNKLIRQRIEELNAIAQQNAILQSGLNREWVINRLMRVVDRCLQAEPVMDRNGEPTGEYRFDSAGANGALRMLGDTLGLFKPAEKKPEDDYANLSDDDLARIASELAAQAGLSAGIAGAQTPPGHQQVIELQAVPKAD